MSLLLTASLLALWVPQGSWAALSIQKFPEQPQKNQDLLLLVYGMPSDHVKSIRWYKGKEPQGSTLLFTYLPGQSRPQRDGNAAQGLDVMGYTNGSMLLRRAQPADSDTYHVAVTVNSELTLRTKTQVLVGEGHRSPLPHLPMSTGIIAAIVVGSVAIGSLVFGCLIYLLCKQGWTMHSHRMTTTEKPELGPRDNTDDSNIYEVMPSPILLVSPFSDTETQNNSMPPPLPLPPPPKLGSQNHQYQDLLHPDPAPYCQLVPGP